MKKFKGIFFDEPVRFVLPDGSYWYSESAIFLYSRDKDYIIEYDDEDETIGKLIEIDQSATSDEWEREGFNRLSQIVKRDDFIFRYKNKKLFVKEKDNEKFTEFFKWRWEE